MWRFSVGFQTWFEVEQFMKSVDDSYPGVTASTRKPNGEEHHVFKVRTGKVQTNSVMVDVRGNSVKDQAELVHYAEKLDGMVF